MLISQALPVMDPFSAVSLASVIVTFVELSAQIAKRLEELSKDGDVPQAFRDTQAQIPLILQILSDIQHSEAGGRSEFKDNVDKVVGSSRELIEQLKNILDKVTVKKGDSKWRRGIKAAISFTEESRLHRISIALRDNVQLLTALNATNAKNEKKAARSSMSDVPSSGLQTDDQGDYHFIVPFSRDPHFIGRENTLKDIEKTFWQQSRAAIAGMGGVGKSQVAVEYAYQFRERNPDAHVFWVYGGSVARFYQGYKKIAQRLSLPSWDDPEASILDIVLDWLNVTTSKFLLILDNADDIDDYWPGKHNLSFRSDRPITNLSNYLPNDCGNLLITSRDARVAQRLIRSGRPHVLRAMTEAEAAQLFASGLETGKSPIPQNQLTDLVRALDCLPLAVTQAASFIDENSITISEYLSSLWNNDPEEFLNEELDDSRRDEESLNSAFRAWRVSFDRIIAQKPLAGELLCLMAMFDRQNIPRSLLNVPGVATSLGVLQAFHMVTARSEPGTFLLHRLTQVLVQTYLRKMGKLEYWKNVSLSCLSNCYPTEIGVEEWPICDALAPHVQYITKSTPTLADAKLDLANILCWAADFDIERGLFTQALARAKRSLELYQDLVLEDDERLAAAFWLHGRLSFYEAKSDEDVCAAEANLQRSLQFSVPSTLIHAESAFELAYLYYSEDREEECLLMAKESFECWAKIGGDSSVRTLDNRHDYALQLAIFGREAEAIANWQEILRLAPAGNASKKTTTVFVYRSKACIHEFQDEHQVAGDLYGVLVKHCSELYGPDHVHVLDYQLIQAEQILRQGGFQATLDIAEAIMDRCKRRSEWRITTSCLLLRAECYRLTGQDELELEARRGYMDILKEKTGQNSKDTYDAMEGVARCLIGQKEFASAAQVCDEILQGRSARSGPNDPEILVALHLVAICKIHNEDHTVAESLLADIRDRKPDVIDQVLVKNTCISLWGQSKWSSVVTWCHKGLEMDDACTLDLRALLLAALRNDGRSEEALALEASFLQIGANAVGAKLDLQPCLPPFELMKRRRFGRIIHPRTWSS